MKTRLAQLLAALGTALAVVSVRWAWVMASDRPLHQGRTGCYAPAVAGLLAVAAIVWAMWLFHSHPRDRGQEIDADSERFPLYKVDRVYSILCCTLGGMAALLILFETFLPASWILTVPPLLFTSAVRPVRAGVGTIQDVLTTGPFLDLFTSCMFVLYYHILAMPGFSLLARTEAESSERRIVLLTTQGVFIALHVLIVVLFVRLIQD